VLDERECLYLPTVLAMDAGELRGEAGAEAECHLQACGICRAELGDTVGVSSWLRDGDPVQRVGPPDPFVRQALLARCVASVAPNLRSRSRLVYGFAAAGLAAAAAMVLALAQPQPFPSSGRAPLQALRSGAVPREGIHRVKPVPVKEAPIPRSVVERKVTGAAVEPVRTRRVRRAGRRSVQVAVRHRIPTREAPRYVLPVEQPERLVIDVEGAPRAVEEPEHLTITAAGPGSEFVVIVSKQEEAQ
jgi:hypothetical protein